MDAAKLACANKKGYHFPETWSLQLWSIANSVLNNSNSTILEDNTSGHQHLISFKSVLLYQRLKTTTLLNELRLRFYTEIL